LTELPLSKTRKNFLFSFLSVEKQTNLTAPYRLDTLSVKKKTITGSRIKYKIVARDRIELDLIIIYK
jgi:hypothetical protein